jgi:hypothetical protein
MLWASNWPHPGRSDKPHERDLLALLSAWAGGAAVRDRILVANPAAVYRFDDTMAAAVRAAGTRERAPQAAGDA